MDDVSLNVRPGRVHALMGENGAGKSTLIKLIAGVVPADHMVVRRGRDVLPLRSPVDAAAAGFRFIHQELNIVPQMSVAENILLGHPTPTRWGVFIDWRKQARQARAALDMLGVTHIDPRIQAGDLPPGDLMLVRMASAIVADAAGVPQLYVLDEPTAALGAAEKENLFKVMQRLKSDGAALIYVSHQLNEIMQICDDITVLRNGKVVSTRPRSEANRTQLIRDITGKDEPRARSTKKANHSVDETASLLNVNTKRLNGLNFSLRKGEVIGLAGLAGAGQSAVLQLFMGLEKPISGRVQFKGARAPANPHAAWKAGISYLPKERRAEGLMLSMSARSNILLPHLEGAWARLGSERSRADALAEHVKLKVTSIEDAAWTLSGGNQQKIVFARAIAGNPDLLLMDEPTRGIDVGARDEIYGLIKEAVAKGTSCVISSSDLQELLNLSDRVVLLSKGRQTGVLQTSELTLNGLSDRLQH